MFLAAIHATSDRQTARDELQGFAGTLLTPPVLPLSVVDTDEYGLSSGNLLICLLGEDMLTHNFPRPA